ncbi:MAG: 3-isopropylmalate dehydratase small subunit [Abyssibacter sp.]|uniref:3-isopropylmalate dehydratase small subunit n=1 Tax=Abyssibacter sp. TaxID=2320200 RepID=UPI00321A837E
MEPLVTHTGRVAALDRSNVDTDAIIPKQYLKSIKRTGFGAFLFDEWRFKDAGTLDSHPEDRVENPDFVLNQPAQRGASILLARRNFGCGSSREHAVWALADYGFRVVIAESYADIFFSNCFKNGVLPLVLETEAIEALMQDATAAPLDLTVDLQACEVRHPDGRVWSFEIDGFRRDALMQGLDEIGKTLQYADAIRAFEARQRAAAPWLYTRDAT